MKFDLLNQKQDKPILCRYGEDGRTIYGTVINSDDEDHTVNLNNFTGIKIQMYKPDGNFVIKDATVSSGHVVIPIDEQMTASAGTGFMDLKLTAIDGTIYTCHATVIIDTPVATDDTITSVSLVNGYVFPDDFQLKLSAGEAIFFSGEDNRTINARATALVEGDGIDITGNTISVDSEVMTSIAGKQEKLTAGTGIAINNNVISSTSQGMEFETIMNWQVSYQAGATHTIENPITDYKLVVLEFINTAGQFAGSTTFNPTSIAYTVQTTILWYALNSMRNITFSFSDASTFKLDNAGISGGSNFVINLYGLK